jgi:hypothetical protein
MMKNNKKIRNKPVWNKKSLRVLKKACQVCDHWYDGPNCIIKYLTDHGIKTTWSSAATMASRKGYKRVKLKLGGWQGGIKTNESQNKR